MKNVKLYSDTLALDLQRFAIDNTEGLVGTGTKLERSSDGTTWEEFADIKTIPELGGDTEKVDVTTLADDRRKQVEGIQNASNVQFQVVYKGPSFAKALAEAGDRKQYQWKVTYPDGMTVTMRGSTSNLHLLRSTALWGIRSRLLFLTGHILKQRQQQYHLTNNTLIGVGSSPASIFIK